MENESEEHISSRAINLKGEEWGSNLGKTGVTVDGLHSFRDLNDFQQSFDGCRFRGLEEE